MAKAYMDIAVNVELRPCVVKIEAGETRGLFHCWEHISEIIEPSPLKGGHSGGVISATVGLVELDDGSINKFYPTAIRFVDNKVLQHFRENPISEEEKNEKIHYNRFNRTYRYISTYFVQLFSGFKG